METVTHALQRLEEKGFTDQFSADGKHLVARDAERAFRPESLNVEEVVRFEGPSNPSDQSIVFALSSDDGNVRGTYTTAFGPTMDGADAQVVKRLNTRA